MLMSKKVTPNFFVIEENVVILQKTWNSVEKWLFAAKRYLEIWRR